ncbi:MAG: adenylate/guanylate cyclase domain-containing protein [Acidimicrobiales bacterium]|nr:adenylate/guanylate cyclase domain-containing protein [Acidimicrobiales bacterium]
MPAHLEGVGGAKLVRRVRRQLMAAATVANTLGVVLVIVCIVWVLPGPPIDVTTELVVANSIVAAVFLFVVCPIGVVWGETWLRSGRRWLQEGRPPSESEVIAVLRAPFRLFLVHATIWLLGAFAFALTNALVDIELLPRVAFTTAFGGLTTSAFAYLLAERLTRPLAIAAMSISDLPKPRLPGIVTRTLLGWLLGTGIPLLGLMISAIFALADGEATATELGVTMVVLSGVGLLAGWWITVLGARAVADPVKSLYQGINALGDGDLDARVEVYDGSVLGLVQAGFNEMAEGLQERDRLRGLYGRQVGEDVAEDSLARGIELGGEVRDVAVLFVDVVGSTRLAATRPAEEVVELLNRFFGTIVEEVHGHGGWINKFQGDATLAVFGAPARVDDAAGRALATARAVAERLPREVPELSAGVGVAYGSAVAGHIGSEARSEFTVIGDPVNEAARLTELAKLCDPMVLASMPAVEAAGPDEAGHWTLAGETTLRGRVSGTRLAQPVGARVTARAGASAESAVQAPPEGRPSEGAPTVSEIRT